MSEQRYDVVYGKDGVRIEPHFCRAYDCFGSNSDHGLTLEDAAIHCAEYHEDEAKAFRNMEHYSLEYYKQQLGDTDD